MRDLQPLVAPRSIAVIGASTNPAKSGGILFANLAAGSFRGPLYPINPRADTVQGHRAFAAIADVPAPVDCAYIALPRDHVRDAVSRCAEAGVRSVCIITSGFADVGEEGRRAQEAIAAIARDAGMLVAGPNTIGNVNARVGMMGSFVNFPDWESGGVAILAQTGIFTGAYILQIMSAESQRVPVGMSIDVGNKPDVDEVDFLAFAARDPGTRVVGLYLEDIPDEAAFLKQAAALRGVKPVVLLRPGRSDPARRASGLHTGARHFESAGFDSALVEAGVVRARDESEFVDLLRTFAWLHPPRGNRVALLTSSGALGVMACDHVAEAGLDVATFAPKTMTALQAGLPEWQPAANPYDFWIAVDTIGSRRGHEIAFAAALADPGVDMVLATLLSPPNADFDGFGEVVAAARRAHPDKPMALVICGGAARERWIRDLEGADVPVFHSTRAAVNALRALMGWTGGLAQT